MGNLFRNCFCPFLCTSGLEKILKKNPKDKNASRTIDFDIILFDGEVIDPALWQRAYCAVPVSELYPDYRAETGETLRKIADRLAHTTPMQQRTDIPIPLPSRN